MLNYTISSLLILSLLLSSCSKTAPEPSISLDGYQIEEGFKLEVVSAEPLIKSPIAMDFDNQGRLWVLEMPGYMPNIDGTGEEEPVGRVVILEDKNTDGYFETAKTFLDELVLARAIKLCYGGLLYAEPPNLWFVEIDGDRPGKKTLVDSTYVNGGNVEHQPNGLDLNIDNWIYSAKGVFRYRLKNGTWLKEATTFRGQWGISHDNTGRLFYNDNSNPLYGDLTLPNQLNQNPYFKNETGENEVILKDRRVYPLQATAVNRGYIDGMLDENNMLKTFTSACGPMIYRGDNFSEAYQSNAFICGPEVNLIKRAILSEEAYQISGKPAYEGKEFLISNDEAFRPVNLYTGPDGALYIVDYHHGIIQHKIYMTAYLRELYLERGLDSIVDYGRILRVRQQDSEMIQLATKSDLELVALLNHANGWVRDGAQRLLLEKQASSMVEDLKNMALSEENGYGPIHALWTLEGLDSLDHRLLESVAQSNDPKRVITALQLATRFYKHNQHRRIFDHALAHQQAAIDLQVVLSAGRVHDKAMIHIEQVLDRHPQDTMMLEAALSSLAGKEKTFHYFLTVVRGKPTHYPILSYLKKIIQQQNTPLPPKTPSTHTDTKTAGLKLYRQHCAACHGEGGKGNKNLAPPLYDSEYIEGDAQKLILLTLHGLQGPITVNGKRYEFSAVMPGLKDNPDLSDQDIANILTFVRNAFSNNWNNIKAADVRAGRSVLPQGKMYTEAELGMGK